MSKKLAAKASLIQTPMSVLSSGPVVNKIEATEPRIKTAPGSMAHFMASQSTAMKEADELRARLQMFQGADVVRSLDPRQVRPSRWANRHDDSFADSAFSELKSEIASAGGNVQPVSVRLCADGSDGGVLNGSTDVTAEPPLATVRPASAVEEPVLNGSTPDRTPSTPGVLTSDTEPGRPEPEAIATKPIAPIYELVFGHRRHRACLELGLPLRAMVVELSDRELFETMERENRARKNLSAWEQGRMYMRALDQGLYPSQRKLAEALAVDVSLVSKSLSLARLPEAVIQAFSSPLDIQFRWAQPLADVLQRDPDAVLARASRVAALTPRLAAPHVLQRLLGLDDRVLNGSTPQHRVITGAAGRQALMTKDARGRVMLRFAAGVLQAADEDELAAFVEKVLSRG